MSLDDLTKKSSLPSASASPKRKRSWAWLLPVGLCLGFLIILGLLFGGRLLPATPVQAAPVITIRAGELVPEKKDPATKTDPDAKGPLLFQASGWVEPDPYTTYVTALVNGVVDEVHALEGQVLKKGDLVATLIDDDAQLNLRTAEQKHQALKKQIVAHCTGFAVTAAQIGATQRKIEALETNVADAQDNAARLAKLSRGAVSQQQVVQARLTTERQVAMLAEARAEIPQLTATITQLQAEQEAMEAQLRELETARARAQLALDRTRITATMDGVVLRLHAAPGKKRMLDMDEPTSAVIVELYNPEQLQARIDVPLNEAAALSAGQTVELVSDLLPDKTFTGKVTRISGQADLQRNTLQAKIAIRNPDPRLRPDMLMRAKFFAIGSSTSTENTTTSSSRLAIYCPEKALVSETLVWVVTPDSTAEKREITLGEESRDGHRLVLSGLRSGESVILPPHADLSPGDRVKVTNLTR